MAGNKISLWPHSSILTQPEFDIHNTYGLKENLLTQSTLARWGGENQYIPSNLAYWMKYVKNDGLKISMAPLHWLYNYAYTGDMLYDQVPEDSLYDKYYPFHCF